MEINITERQNNNGCRYRQTIFSPFFIRAKVYHYDISSEHVEKFQNILRNNFSKLNIISKIKI